MKLIGNINGIEIKFDFYPPNIFKGTIPRNLTGIYIVELLAISDSGVKTFFTLVEIAIEFDKIRVRMIDPLTSKEIRLKKSPINLIESYSYNELNTENYKIGEICEIHEYKEVTAVA